MGNLAILIPAAGASSRMKGADKLLEDVDGQPCIAHVVRRTLQVTPDVFVTLPSTDHPRVDALDGYAIKIVPVPDASSGMAQSLKVGVAAVPKSNTAVMILPADMPDITGQDMAKLWAVFQASGVKILQAAKADGTPGHPVIFDRSLFREFKDLQGDIGAKSIVDRHKKSRALLPLDGDRAAIDLDTPQDWAAWRASR